MHSFRVEGLRLIKHKETKVKHRTVVQANSKQEIWNNPEDYGFLKVFNVSQT